MLIKIAKLIGSLLAVTVFAVVFAPARPHEVEVTRVRRGEIDHVVTSVSAGTLEARRTQTVASESGGRVTAVLKREGEPVTAGERIAEIESTDLEERLELEKLNLRAARARLAESKIRMEQSGRDYRRVWELFHEGVFSRKQAETAAVQWQLAQAEVDTLRTNLAKLEATYGVAERRFEASQLTAPFDGILKAVHVESGQFLMPRQPAFDVIDPTGLQISAVMDEVDAQLLEVGQDVRLTTDAFPDRTFPGKLTWVAPVVSISKKLSRGIEVEIAIDEVPEELRIGMSVDVDVVVGHSENALWVPSRAVKQGRDGRTSVFLVADLGRRGRAKAERRVIEQGIYTFHKVEIEGGVDEGDLVILDVEKVDDGEAIRVTSGLEEDAGDEEAGDAS